MKKSVVIIFTLLLVLLIPVPTGVYKDGGTRTYTALTYKIVDWNKISADGIYAKTSVYPFPLNFLSIDRLWSREERKAKEDNTLYSDGENPKTQSQFVSHRDFYADISLYIPWDFEYKITCSDNETGEDGFSISFRPKGEDGFVSVEFLADVFTVCGTGLESQEITLGKYNAYKGTYDGKPVWDFIHIFDTAGEYVIKNCGADEWLLRYESEVEEALSTLSVATCAIGESRATEIAKAAVDKEYERTVAWFEHREGIWFVKFYNDSNKSGEIITLTADGKVIEEEKSDEENSVVCSYPTASYFN